MPAGRRGPVPCVLAYAGALAKSVPDRDGDRGAAVKRGLVSGSRGRRTGRTCAGGRGLRRPRAEIFHRNVETKRGFLPGRRTFRVRHVQGPRNPLGFLPGAVFYAAVECRPCSRAGGWPWPRGEAVRARRSAAAGMAGAEIDEIVESGRQAPFLHAAGGAPAPDPVPERPAEGTRGYGKESRAAAGIEAGRSSRRKAGQGPRRGGHGLPLTCR